MPVHGSFLPPITKTHKVADEVKKNSGLYLNPFVCSDEVIKTFQSKTIKEQEEEKNFFRNLKVWDRTTFASKERALSFSARQIVIKSGSRSKEKEEKYLSSNKNDQTGSLSTAKCSQMERESLREFIEQRREMSRAQFAIDMKKDAVRVMKTMVSNEERKICITRQKLENDALTLEASLKETDERAMEALNIADELAKAKVEKNREIRKVILRMMAIKSDIQKYEDILKKYKLYQDFLNKLSPQEWQQTQMNLKRITANIKKKIRERNMPRLFPPVSKKAQRRLVEIFPRAKDTGVLRPLSRRKSSIPGSKTSLSRSSSEASYDGTETQRVDSDSEEEPELYFTDPQQLLHIFAELEEQNGLLFQTIQELDTKMQQINERGHSMQEKMNQKLKYLNKQKELITEALEKEREKVEELKLKCEMFSFGEYKSEEQDKMLSALNKKITEVYVTCIGEVQATINPLQMLGSIEHRLEELCDKLASAPKDLVAAAKKAKQKERRLRLHDENLKHQLREQELRLMQTLERATAKTHKTEGRKLMKRSEPPDTARRQKRKEDKKQAAKRQEEQQYLFFFYIND